MDLQLLDEDGNQLIESRPNNDSNIMNLTNRIKDKLAGKISSRIFPIPPDLRVPHDR